MARIADSFYPPLEKKCGGYQHKNAKWSRFGNQNEAYLWSNAAGCKGARLG